jgi:hypothetical protein
MTSGSILLALLIVGYSTIAVLGARAVMREANERRRAQRGRGLAPVPASRADHEHVAARRRTEPQGASADRAVRSD